MTTPSNRTLARAIEVIPSQCHEAPTWKGVLWLVRDLLLYAGVVAALVSTDAWWLLFPLWLLAGLVISALFIIGHDAAHGALFKSSRLNYIVGQLSMLPSLHVHEAWVFGHNRVHHGHTVREGMDYVWHPLTPDQFRQLSPMGKLGHRLKWSCLGAGIYYLQEIWWQKMIWNYSPPRGTEGRTRRDRAIVAGYALSVTAALVLSGAMVYGSAVGALWMWVKVFVVPFIVWNYSIGFAVYVHHISADILWHKRRDWDKFKGRLEGTTVIHFPALLNTFYHNIFLHVAHHVDMRIPFYALPEANRALIEEYGTDIVEKNFTVRDYLASTKHCKLFDFDSKTWLDYGEAAEGIAALTAV